MLLIHIALQEGFVNDTVTICLNDVEVYSKTGVKTRMQTGLADKVNTNAVEGLNDLKMEVVNRKATVKVPLIVESGRTLYVGFSMTSVATISYKISYEPFRYA